jgi:hypothetical protein
MVCESGPNYPVHSLVTTATGFVVGSVQATFIIYTLDSLDYSIAYGNQFRMTNKISMDSGVGLPILGMRAFFYVC